MFNELARTWKVSWIVAVSCLVGACQDYGFEEQPSSIFISRHQIEDIPLNPVDILFVVDNSGSMAAEQTQLGESFKNFYNILDKTSGTYHIAIVTTGMKSPACQDCNSNDTLGCINMNETGTTEIESGKFQYRRGHITWNGSDPVFDFKFDESCRVVTSSNLPCFFNPDDNGVERGTVMVGINGCGYERGLEAMKVALSGDLLGGDNKGFLRDDSSLAVIIVSDEEDCGPVGYVNELLGNDVVCYHAAIGESSLNQWEPLPSVENYRQFLLRLKNNQVNRVKFAAIVGLTPPVNPGDKINPDDTKITFNHQQFDLDQKANPVSSNCRALPGTRYRDLYNAFGEYGFIDTICQSDFSKTMEKIAQFITCPKYFDLVELPLDLGLANILVNGVAVPRYSCTVLVNGDIVPCTGLTDTATCSAGTCVETWSYQKPEDITEVPKPAGGRINFADHYNPCSLITQGTLRIEFVYVVQ